MRHRVHAAAVHGSAVPAIQRHQYPNFAHGEIMTAGACGALATQRLTHNVLVTGVVAAEK